DVAAAVGRIAPARDQIAILQLVEQSADVARVPTQGVSEGLLARWTLVAEKVQRDQVTGAQPARLERDLERPSTDPGEVFEKREEPLVRRRLWFAFDHGANDT